VTGARTPIRSFFAPAAVSLQQVLPFAAVQEGKRREATIGQRINWVAACCTPSWLTFMCVGRPRALRLEEAEGGSGVASEWTSVHGGEATESGIWQSSTMKKRRMKMNKHKLKKRRKDLKHNTKLSRA